MNFCVPTFVFVQLIAHLFGDYFLQSDWMAAEKTKKSLAALAHALTYTLPFLLLAHSWQALVFIAGTHFVVDRWRLARYVCWIKNFLAPPFSLGRPEDQIFFRAGDKLGGDLRAGDFVEGRAVRDLFILEVGGNLPQAARYMVIAPVTKGGLLGVVPVTKWWHSWEECKVTGYHQDRPAWLATWLLIITDNTIHLCCNAAALSWWP